MKDNEKLFNLRRKEIGLRYQNANFKLAESENVDDRLKAELTYLGSLQECGEKGLFYTIDRLVTTSQAKLRMWPPERIQEAIDEGRRTQRMITSADE